MALQALVLPLVSIFRSTGFKEAMKAVNGLDGEFKKVAQSAGLAAASFSAASVIQKVTAYVDEAVTVTQKYERNMLALNQVFQAQSENMRKFTVDAQNMGISQGQAAQAGVFLGSVLKQYGLDQATTAKETQKLIGLSQDLATTYGYDLQEALLAMTALFRGEYDPIEKFGVAMKQNEINSLLAARGQDKLTGTMLFQAQVQARLDLLYQRSADSMGAFERANGTLYVAQQKLNATLENSMIAFGEPLQTPIAEVTNIFADMVQQLTPVMGVIGGVLGAIVDFAAKVGGGFLNGVATAISNIIGLIPAAIKGLYDLTMAINSALGGRGPNGEAPTLSDTRSRQLTKLAQDVAYAQQILTQKTKEGALGLSQYEKNLRDAQNALTVAKYGTYDAGQEVALFQNRVSKVADQVEITAKTLTYFQGELEAVGVYSVDAEGKLTGLAGVFTEIDENARKSKAKESLEEMGFAAGQIETILTKPDWAQIFGQISRLAQLAAIDVMSITGSAQYGAAIAQNNAQAALEKLRNDILSSGKGSSATKTAAKDTVSDFLTALNDEMYKQSAKTKLAAMGASEGLIDLILGNADWTKLWNQIKTGVISLEELQKKFNKTAAGVEELKKKLEEAQQIKDDFIDGLNSDLEKAKQRLEEVTAAADAFYNSLSKLVDSPILPTLQPEIGQFEQQIIGMIESVRSELDQGLVSGTIVEESFATLSSLAERELALLQANARQRDELFNKYNFTKGLIEEYRGAVAGALSLTTLFNKLTKETEKRTVTEVSKGLVELAKSSKTFAVTISRSYEETIDKVTDKTGALLDGFRVMAEKSRTFALNLRALHDLGLDPQLFNQLVQAGVEAGGETAQAIVDGGIDSVKELNSIYEEIDSIGGQLGFDLAPTFYEAGDSLMTGLLDGIRSQQQALEDAAIKMASDFSATFKSKLNIAVDIPVQAAQAEVTKIENAITQAQTANVEAISKVGDLIAGAKTYLSKTGLTAAQIAGATEKLGAYQALLKDVVSGQVQDITGVASGMSSAKLQSAATGTGGTNVNNYYIEVKADTRTSGAKAGEAVVQSINNFQTANGPFSAYLK